MKRNIEQYKNCSPDAILKMSDGAIFHAISDMRADLLELHGQLQAIKESHASCNTLEMRDCVEIPIHQWENLEKAIA